MTMPVPALNGGTGLFQQKGPPFFGVGLFC
jgi:hypothetical protein